MNRIILLAGALLALASCHKNTVVVPCESSVVRLQVVSPEIVRVSVSPDGHFSDRPSLVE